MLIPVVLNAFLGLLFTASFAISSLYYFYNNLSYLICSIILALIIGIVGF